jgi:hypothetical protein
MRRVAAISACMALTLSSGCTWLLGQGELPQPQALVRVANMRADYALQGLHVAADFLGAGERVVTSRNVWGRVARLVNPFGEGTLVFKVRMDNQTQASLIVYPQRATLTLGAGAEVPSLGLADYRKRWPVWPVETAEQSTDQQAAYDFVLNSLLIQRIVAPGLATEGRLAFLAVSGPGELSLKLPYRLGDAPEKVALLHWSPR